MASKNECNHIITLGYLKTFTKGIVNVDWSCLPVSAQTDSYCPTYAQLTEGRLVPNFSSGESPNGNVDGIVVRNLYNYSPNQCVQQCDVTAKYTMFRNLTISSNKTDINKCGGSVTLSYTHTYEVMTKAMVDCAAGTGTRITSVTVEDRNDSELTWHKRDGEEGTFNYPTFSMGKNDAVEYVPRGTHITASVNFRGGDLSSNTILISQAGIGGSYSSKQSEVESATGIFTTSSTVKEFGCEGGTFSAEGIGYYDVYTTYAWVNDCGDVDLSRQSTVKTRENERVSLGTKSGSFPSKSCPTYSTCNAESALTFTWRGLTASETFRQIGSLSCCSCKNVSFQYGGNEWNTSAYTDEVIGSIVVAGVGCDYSNVQFQSNDESVIKDIRIADNNKWVIANLPNTNGEAKVGTFTYTYNGVACEEPFKVERKCFCTNDNCTIYSNNGDLIYNHPLYIDSKDINTDIRTRIGDTFYVNDGQLSFNNTVLTGTVTFTGSGQTGCEWVNKILYTYNAFPFITFFADENTGDTREHTFEINTYPDGVDITLRNEAGVPERYRGQIACRTTRVKIVQAKAGYRFIKAYTDPYAKESIYAEVEIPTQITCRATLNMYGDISAAGGNDVQVGTYKIESGYCTTVEVAFADYGENFLSNIRCVGGTSSGSSGTVIADVARNDNVASRTGSYKIIYGDSVTDYATATQEGNTAPPVSYTYAVYSDVNGASVSWSYGGSVISTGVITNGVHTTTSSTAVNLNVQLSKSGVDFVNGGTGVCSPNSSVLINEDVPVTPCTVALSLIATQDGHGAGSYTEPLGAYTISGPCGGMPSLVFESGVDVFTQVTFDAAGNIYGAWNYTQVAKTGRYHLVYGESVSNSQTVTITSACDSEPCPSAAGISFGHNVGTRDTYDYSFASSCWSITSVDEDSSNIMTATFADGVVTVTCEPGESGDVAHVYVNLQNANGATETVTITATWVDFDNCDKLKLTLENS